MTEGKWKGYRFNPRNCPTLTEKGAGTSVGFTPRIESFPFCIFPDADASLLPRESDTGLLEGSDWLLPIARNGKGGESV